MASFIYLKRGTEIAILEDPVRLPAYEADGWCQIDAREHQDLWRKKALLARAQAEIAGQQQTRQAVRDAWEHGCPTCKSVQVVRPVGAPPWCQSCKTHATW